MNMVEPESMAVVGTTRKFNAKEAGIDLAEKIRYQLQKDPDFIVLFSTIHYMNYGGFKNLLDGIHSVFQKDIKLIGGTVRGFVNNDGCFARGATALAVSSNEMDVAIGIGHNTKRNPKKAAKNCIEEIQKKLENSAYKNGYLLNIIAGAEVPNLPPIGTKKIIKPGASTKAILKLFTASQSKLQMGSARDEEILEEITSMLPEYSMMSGATLDDGPGFKNYQFYNRQVLKNSIVVLGLKTDSDVFVKSTNNMKKTNIDFEITKTSKDKRIIHEINGKPALGEFLRLLDWPKEALNEETWLQTTFYFPIGGKTIINSEDENSPHGIGMILGNSLVLTCKLIGSHASILTIDGKGLFNAIDDNLNYIDFTPKFGLISSCITRFETLGFNIYDIRERVLSHMRDKPFIVFYVGGESTYSQSTGLKYSNISFNSSVIS
jgi:hypothetical protein